LTRRVPRGVTTRAVTGDGRTTDRTGGEAGTGTPNRPDRGVSTLELALLTPILLLVMLLVVQFAMVYHARHVALAAAQAGARIARSEDGAAWEQRSRVKARTYLRQIGPRLLNGPRVDTDATGDERFVVVSGYAVEVLPFFRFRISERSGGPIECFRPDVGPGDACGPAS
jgi:TadE-like protein